MRSSGLPPTAQVTLRSGAALPASSGRRSVHWPSPPRKRTLSMASWAICLSMGPAWASRPPKKMASGFLPLMAVRMGTKSVDLSPVYCLSTISMPCSRAWASNSATMPWP